MATFGSHISEEQIRLLRRFDEGVILAPDNDNPGQKWFKSLFEGLSPFIPVYRVGEVEGEGKDLGDLPQDMLKSWVEGTLQIVFDEAFAINL
jgi:DNA primase